MQFRKVRARITHSLTNETVVVVFQHEIPILQARFGIEKVQPMEDNDACGIAMVDQITEERDKYNLPIIKRVPLDRTLEEEWERMMERPALVQISETDKRPAPLVAFPRGVLDLEDFYARTRRTGNVVDIQEQKTAVTRYKVPEKQKSDRKKMMEALDERGVEYRGNISNVDLKELYESTMKPEAEDDTSVSTDLQDQG